MNIEEARIAWQKVIETVRAANAAEPKQKIFRSWPEVRATLESELKEYSADLTRGLTKGLIDFAAYSPSDDMLVLVPRSKIKDADFIIVYRSLVAENVTSDGELKRTSRFDYFGIRKEDSGPVETTKAQVKMGFVGAVV